VQESGLGSPGADDRSWDQGKPLSSRRSGVAGQTPRHANGPPRLVGEEILGDPLKSLSTPRNMSRGTVFDLFPVSSRSGIFLPLIVAGVFQVAERSLVGSRQCWTLLVASCYCRALPVFVQCAMWQFQVLEHSLYLSSFVVSQYGLNRYAIYFYEARPYCTMAFRLVWRRLARTLLKT
jgi:hypothetical protein